VSLYPIIYQLQRMAGELRERACRLDEAVSELSKLAPKIIQPGEFKLMGQGRPLSFQEKRRLVEMAQARGREWERTAALVATYQDGLRLVEVLKQVPKQETLPDCEPEAAKPLTAQRQGR
jgi:hypothetical protein